MIEIIFLIVLGILWMSFAVANDLKERIVPNWLNFSLIIFALGTRFFYSLFNSDFSFFYQGLIGFGIFFVLGNAFYYSKMFAGGDAKLMIALGAILGFSNIFAQNLNNFAIFFILFLFSGAIYGIAWSGFLFSRNYKACKKEIPKQFNKNKRNNYLGIVFGVLFLIFGFYNSIFFYFGILIFFLPFLYTYAKAVDESCLVKNMKTKNLSEGDWLYHELKIGKKTIKANWEGLTKEEIKLIRKKFKEIKIRFGIPFTPVFLISFLVLVYLYFKGVSVIGLV